MNQKDSGYRVEDLIECRRFHVQRITHSAADGSELVRDVVRHPGSVVILPLLDGDRICLIRNHRIAVGKTLIELPAGTREPDEDPAVTASRELIEETGYRSSDIQEVLAFFAAPGILDERMILYTASGLTAGQPAREAGEEIENLVVTREESQKLITNGSIEDAKTLVGLMWWHANP